MRRKITNAPLKRQPLKDRVSVLIKEAVLTGKLVPGERIVEMALAEELGVATTSVREALFELEAQGFVTRVANRGTFVTQLTEEDIEQILRVREELEGLAVELAEARAEARDIADLRRILGRMRAAGEQGDLEAFYRCDLEFHRAIWALSGNRHLVKALDMCVVPLFAFFIMKNPSDSVDELIESVAMHSRVVDAIEGKRNARRSMEEALQFFRQQEKWMLFDSGNSTTSPAAGERLISGHDGI